MKLQFSHPYNDNLTINFGQFTQIVGQNQQLKYYMWQLLMWYFDGKKYSEEDLNLFNQAEPEILNNGVPLKRNSFKIISISTIQDLIEQMTYKKGTVSFDFMKKRLDTLDVMSDIDDINDQLYSIAKKINTELNFSIEGIVYHSESLDFTAEQLLLKNFKPYFQSGGQNISFEFVENESKLMFFLEMLEEHLRENTEKVLLVFKNLDDYLKYSSFKAVCQKIEAMCSKNSNLYVIIFPSSEGYLYAKRSNIEFVNIISDYIKHYYEFEFLYQRFIEQYPTNQQPTEEEFLETLQKISGYLFSKEIEYVSLSAKDLVALKILNNLYQYDKKLDYPIFFANPLEINFLLDES